MNRVKNGYILCMLGNLNGITSAFGVQVENHNSNKVVEFWFERSLCVGDAYSVHKSLH